ncbi:MAG: DUF6268 family outer membrane beta-barrel protein [Pirellulales bacterium]|nr:DUF6268 family outer membrane beta-barrel protein [Pirellulales bacterium]
MRKNPLFCQVARWGVFWPLLLGTAIFSTGNGTAQQLPMAGQSGPAVAPTLAGASASGTPTGGQQTSTPAFGAYSTIEPASFFPPGYPSGYPGPTTAEGAPLGYGRGGGPPPGSAGAAVAYPGSEPPFDPPPLVDGPATTVTPEAVLIDESCDTCESPSDQNPRPRGGPPRGVKPGMLQAINISATYLPDLADDGFSVLDLEHSFTLGFPLPSRESPLLLSPGFNVHLLEGPAAPDLPSTLYDAYLSIRWLRKVSDRWMLNAAVIPGWYSDWQTGSDDALRVPAQLFGIYECNPQLKVILGVVYLDRQDIPFLPAVGLIYSPNEDTTWEFVMPRPRYLRRIRATGHSEDWLSISGEFGGGQWAFQRSDNTTDVLSARDYRLLIGWERKRFDGGWGMKAELGYVFSRVYEFESETTPDYEPGDTLAARLMLIY